MLRSRYAYGSVCADTHYDEEGFVRDLVAVGRRLPQRGLLFPMNDDYVDMLPRHADVLGEWFLLTQPAPERMKLLGRQGAAVPRGVAGGRRHPRRRRSSTARRISAAAAEEVPFPALLKPATPLAFRRRVGSKVITSNVPRRARRGLRARTEFGTLLLQEFVPGGDEQLYNLQLVPRRGVSGPWRSSRGASCASTHASSATSASARASGSPRSPSSGLRLLRELGYHGISGVEFKQDPRDGRYKLMEINARSTILAHTLAPYVGVDIPYVAYRDAIGSPVTAPRQREGVRFIQCSTDMPDSLAEIVRGEMGLGEWLRSLRGTRVDGILALDDPVPGLLDLAGVVRARLSRRASRDGAQPVAR